MELNIIAQFAFATLLPVAASLVLSYVRQHAKVARLHKTAWQVIVGIIFGIIAIYGTEAGIPYDGAMMNVRDAAPLAAGLFFGGPAGIIAGLIGGVERWLAVLWGVGAFTQVACSVATVIAGVYAALLHKYLFDKRMPTWMMAFVTGVVAEVIHLLLVFVTNLDQVTRAFTVVQACSIPMIGCVAVSTALSAFALALQTKQPLIVPRAQRGVAQIVQNRLLIGVLAAFVATTGFTAMLQTSLSRSEAESLLRLNIADVEQDIKEASDKNLLTLAQVAAEDLHTVSGATNEDCQRLCIELNVAEVNVINSKGIITASSNPEFVGFDMASGEQSASFLILLPGGEETELVQNYQPIAYDDSIWRKYAGITVEGGFIQVGYDASNFLGDLSTQVESAVRNRHVGKSGELVVVDSEGTIISTRNDIAGQDADRLVADTAKASAGTLFTTSFADEECFAEYQEVEGYRIIALMTVAEAEASRDVSVLIMAFMEVIVFAALFLVIYFAIKRIVVRSIWQVNGRLGQITKGDLDVEVDVRESSEFSSLSDDINKTVGALKESIAVVQADLDMAADIQANTLPDITSAITRRSEFELYASMEPAKEVGGDFYDFFMVDEHHLGLVVADVSGKGIPAALFMMQSKTVIKLEALSGLTPDKVLLRANADLSEKNDDDMFTTAWIGVLEIPTGSLTFADAGHEKLALYRHGVWELLPKPNGAVALASFSQEDYEELPKKYQFRSHTLTLHPGDALFQYTDGVTEATDAENELFGEERLLKALNDAPSVDPKVLLPFVRARIAEFVKDAPQFDDITMLSLLYEGSGGGWFDDEEDDTILKV